MPSARVVLNGFGKMGKAVDAALKAHPDISILGVADPAIDGATPLVGYPVLDNDILVDFSTPEACAVACEFFRNKHGKAVIGTTPLGAYGDRIRECAVDMPIVMAANFSPDVNLFVRDVAYVASTATTEDSISIHEIHRAEKTKTSGTAIELAKVAANCAGKDGYVLLREGTAFDINGKPVGMPKLNDPKSAIGYVQVSCERFGDEQGTHIVRIGNADTYRELKVKATRPSYGEGVCRSVLWLAEQREPGLYSFGEHVLGLRAL
jgi:dihydrodipicolinate reductase